MLPRFQGVEIQDLRICPHFIRDGVTDYLGFVINLLGIYNPIAPILKKVLEKSEETQIIDLCSGAGKNLVKLSPLLPEMKKILLTDLYPNEESFKKIKKINPTLIDYSMKSVDARNYKEKGLRTLFTSFHHFSDEDATLILKSAFDERQPIAIFEFTDRSLWSLLMTAPTPLMMLLLTPLMWPWKLSRILGTYLLPLIPLIAGIDVIISVFRTRKISELKKMTESLQASNYTWEYGTKRTAFMINLVYVIGYPQK